jgi:hypothetical protein
MRIRSRVFRPARATGYALRKQANRAQHGQQPDQPTRDDAGYTRHGGDNGGKSLAKA